MARMSWLNASMFHLTINTRFEEGDNEERALKKRERAMHKRCFLVSKQWRHIC